MKAKTIIAIIATMCSLSSGASNNIINESVILPVASHRTYYASNDLADSVKWECDYDSMGRLVTKAGYVLAPSGEWKPRVAYTVFYGSDETIVTTAKWNARHGNFRTTDEQQHYAAGVLPSILQIK